MEKRFAVHTDKITVEEDNAFTDLSAKEIQNIDTKEFVVEVTDGIDQKFAVIRTQDVS